MESRVLKTDITLELGDIIKFIAPTNPKLHEKTFFIDYIDTNRVIVIETETTEKIDLTIDQGIFDDSSIKQIHLLDRSDEKGYIKQNGLSVGTWITINFGGDEPYILNGKITNIEEDMISIESFPEKQVIFIDFAYKGIPLDLNVE